jgi:hypothetical protein
MLVSLARLVSTSSCSESGQREEWPRRLLCVHNTLHTPENHLPHSPKHAFRVQNVGGTASSYMDSLTQGLRYHISSIRNLRLPVAFRIESKVLTSTCKPLNDLTHPSLTSHHSPFPFMLQSFPCPSSGSPQMLLPDWRSSAISDPCIYLGNVHSFLKSRLKPHHLKENFADRTR